MPKEWTYRDGASLSTGKSPYYYQRQDADLAEVSGERYYERDGADLVEAGGELDADAQTLIDAVETADGQALEVVLQNAISSFVVGAKSAGIWTTLNSGAWRLLAGPRTLAGALVLGNGPSPTNNGFVAGDYTRSTGVKSDNTIKYLDTGISNTTLASDDRYFAIYLTEGEAVNSFSIPMGVGLVSDPGAHYLILRNLTANDIGFSMRCLNDTDIYTVDDLSQAYTGYIGNGRDSNANQKTRANGVNNTTLAAASTPVPGNVNVFNRTTTASVVTSTISVSFYYVGTFLDFTESEVLETLVENYVSAISGL